MESHWSLRRFYLFINRRWFNGELPLDTILTWEPCGDDRWASCELLSDGRFHIRIDRAVRGIHSYWLQLLFHEMAHIQVYLTTGRWINCDKRIHGKKSLFQAEMKRLAAAGAFDDLW